MAHVITPAALRTVLTSSKQNAGAAFTAKSNLTGTDFTFKIVRKLFKEKWYTQVYIEYEYEKYKYLGNYWQGKIYDKKKVVSTTTAEGIAWICEKVLEQNEEKCKQFTLYHLGKCLMCGRTLTDALSIEIGLGPKCRGAI